MNPSQNVGERQPTPWPDGPNRAGLFEIVSFGINPKNHEIDFALSHAAVDRLCPDDRADLASLLGSIRDDILGWPASVSGPKSPGFPS